MQLDEDTSSDDEPLAMPIVADDSDCEPTSPAKELPDSSYITAKDVPVNTYVLVKVCGKRAVAHFAGIVQELNNEEDAITVQFYKKDGNHFVIPEGDDVSTVDITDVVLILPSPITSGEISQMRSKLKFDVDLSAYL